MQNIITWVLDNPVFLAIVFTLVIGIFSTLWVKSSMKKYSQVASASGLTGGDAAQRMLSFYGVNNVQIYQGKEGNDYYDPKNHCIVLSPSIFRGMSVTSFAVICHEVGHACQHAEGYGMMKFRTALVPLANFGSSLWLFLLLIGVFLQSFGLVIAAAIMYSLVLLFSLVTLPVEFNASHRAIKYMSTIGLPNSEVSGARHVLTACAFTYIAATLASVAQLLVILSRR